MRPAFAKGNARTVSKLLALRLQAQKDRKPRVVLRIQGIVMSLEGRTAGEIADILAMHRSTVSLWIEHWNEHGEKGLWEGKRPGRPRGLDADQQERLRDILDSGPVAYGLETGIWTSPLLSQVIEEEFGQQYHPGHLRRMLKDLGYSLQRPTARLAQAKPEQERKWVRYTYPNLKKKARSEGAVIVYEDEASFRQTPTLHATWARCGSQPQIPTRLGFTFTSRTTSSGNLIYLLFLDKILVPAFYRRRHRVYLIQDNASYHKKQETYEWFADNRRYVEVFQLPPYWPQLNATERVWNYTRKHATHNRFFEKPQHLCRALYRTFHKIQRHPEEIQNLLAPFFDQHVELFTRGYIVC